MLDIEHVEQRAPVAARHLLPVQKQQFVKIVPDPQMQPELARRPVARDKEPREQAPRAVYDRDRVRQPEVVFGDSSGMNGIKSFDKHADSLARAAAVAGSALNGR